MKYILIGLSIFLIIQLTGCADKITSVEDLNNGDNERLSKFSQIQSKVFSTNCALSGCHGDNNTQANLNLSSGKAYSNLININSFLYPEMKRVIPGNAEESLLIKVLNYNFTTKMPPQGKLDQSLIDSIAVWINKGAPND